MARGPSLIPQRVKNTGVDLLVAGLFLGGGVLALGYANKRFGILDKIIGGAGSLGFGIGQATGKGLSSIPQGLFSGLTGIDLSKANDIRKTVIGGGSVGQTSTPAAAASYTQDKDGKVTITDSQGNIIPTAYGDSGENQNFFASLITAIEKNPQATAEIGQADTRNLTSGKTFKTFTDLFKDIQAAPTGGATPKAPLDVAKIIKQAGQRLTAAQVQATNKKTPQRNLGFGGYGSAIVQESTLQALIAANAKRYPQYFKVA